MKTARFPALVLGLHALLGAGWALHPHPIYLLGHLLLFFLSPISLYLFGILLSSVAFLSTVYHSPPTQIDAIEGKNTFTIEKIAPNHSPFQTSIAHRGWWDAYPCTLYLPYALKERAYLIDGTLKADSKTLKYRKIESLDAALSFAYKRFSAKQKVRRYIKNHIPNKQAAHFLSTLVTGDIDDRQMAADFMQVGLSHILAISGFHFALVALFVGSFFRLVFPYKIAHFFLLLALLSFFLFLGPSPSITRAFIAIALYLVGSLFDRRASGLQYLGFGLLIEVFAWPLSLTHAGFHLSFLCTLGLLLFFQPAEKALTFFLPARSPYQMTTLVPAASAVALILGWTRKALAATFAVHIAALPATLFLFGSFPLLSLIYNLFFPFFFSLSLFLLLLSFPLPFLHPLNNWLTSTLLHMTATPPPGLKIIFHTPPFPYWLVVAVTSFILFFGLWRPPPSSIDKYWAMKFN